jgi:hypothetical protein
MRRTTLIAALVLAALPVPADAQTGEHAGERLPDGAMCADRRPADPADANARCESGKCRPGPSIRSQAPAWYCVARDMACALPGMEGRGEGAYVTLDGTRYQCLDPGTGSPHRFAPIR